MYKIVFIFLWLYSTFVGAGPLTCMQASNGEKRLSCIVVCGRENERDKLCLYHPLENRLLPTHTAFTEPLLEMVSVSTPNQSVFKKQKTYQAFQKRYHTRPMRVYAVSQTGILYAFDEGLDIKWVKPLLEKRDVFKKALLNISDLYIEDQWHTLLTIVLMGDQKILWVLDVTDPLQNEKDRIRPYFLTRSFEALQDIQALFVGHVTREQGAVIIAAMREGKAFLEGFDPKTGKTLMAWELEKVKGPFTALLPIDRYSQGILDRIYAVDSQNHLWSLETNHPTPRKVLNGDFLENTLIKQHALVGYWNSGGKGIKLYWRVGSEVSRLSGVYEVLDQEESDIHFAHNTIQRILAGSYSDHFISGHYLFTLSLEGSLAMALRNTAIQPLCTNFLMPTGIIKKLFDHKSQRFMFLVWDANRMFSVYFAPTINNKYGKMSWRKRIPE